MTEVGNGAPTAGPEGQPIVITKTTSGGNVYGYVDESGRYVPLAYDEGLSFDTGYDEPSSGAAVAGAGIASVAAALVLGGGVLWWRRRGRI
ncbi:hypothetical protein [Gordonia rhizosphera]|uniref:hypothetical protein n=1 Tax=Gordonia rhizosphera TaxID=83341 RepID=UPI0012F6D3BE|nr:hypothetical protein [Gordonia rhizosphera]